MTAVWMLLLIALALTVQVGVPIFVGVYFGSLVAGFAAAVVVQAIWWSLARESK